MTPNRYLSAFYAVRRRLQVGIAVVSALGGGILGAALTFLGKVVAEAPPATLGNYAWNFGVFAILGLVIGPSVIWSALRHAPLWRAIVEPLAVAIASAVFAVFLGSGVALLVLPPIAVAAAAARLAGARGVAERIPSRGAV